jgi:hypothetical protein
MTLVVIGYFFTLTLFVLPFLRSIWHITKDRVIELLVEESILFLVTSLQNCKVVHSTCCYANLRVQLVVW